MTNFSSTRTIAAALAAACSLGFGATTAKADCHGGSCWGFGGSIGYTASVGFSGHIAYRPTYFESRPVVVYSEPEVVGCVAGYYRPTYTTTRVVYSAPPVRYVYTPVRYVSPTISYRPYVYAPRPVHRPPVHAVYRHGGAVPVFGHHHYRPSSFHVGVGYGGSRHHGGFSFGFRR